MLLCNKKSRLAHMNQKSYHLRAVAQPVCRRIAESQTICVSPPDTGLPANNDNVEAWTCGRLFLCHPRDVEIIDQ